MKMSVSNLYSRISQLYPACIFTTYKQVQALILGDTVSDCSVDQRALLISTTILFSLICLGSCIIADSNVQYVSWIKRFEIIPANVSHGILSTIGFMTMIMFNPPAFDCQFQTPLSNTLAQCIPILVGTGLYALYTGVFSIPQT
jgi:hypothetical protein